MAAEGEMTTGRGRHQGPASFRRTGGRHGPPPPVPWPEPSTTSARSLAATDRGCPTATPSREAQQDRLKAWITETLPRTTREVGAWIETECGIAYQSRSGLIALLHRLEMEHRKPQSVSRKLDPDKQAAFIEAYEDLLNHWWITKRCYSAMWCIQRMRCGR
jgi:hypothetical protein